MGSGAVMASTLFPVGYLNLQGSPVPGPNAFLITTSPGVSPSVAQRSLDRIDRVLNGSPDGPVGGVVSVLRPAEIANYGAVGATPTVLASVLAGGALGALGFTLASSVRRRRRELALLKALGLTGRQLWASVAWQSSVSVAVGVVIGMPIGIAFGRWLWTCSPTEYSAVPDPTVPALSMVLIALGGVVLRECRGRLTRTHRSAHADGARPALGMTRRSIQLSRGPRYGRGRFGIVPLFSA